MSLYSDYLAPEKYRDGESQPVSDRVLITLTLAGVGVIVGTLIAASRLLISVL